ncbi:MAG: acyl carrier protein [Chloroflexota bacterium]
MNVTKQKIREFLNRFVRDVEIQDDDNIFSKGYVNSLFAMQLVMFVETEFSFTVDDEDLDIANFQSINAITELVQRKQGIPT